MDVLPAGCRVGLGAAAWLVTGDRPRGEADHEISLNALFMLHIPFREPTSKYPVIQCAQI